MAGEQIVLPYQYEWHNFLFGSATWVTVEQVEGLLDTPDVNVDDFDRQTAHGGHPGIITLKRRLPTFDLVVTGSPGDEIETRLALVNRTFQPQRIRYSRISEPLVFSRPGRPLRMVMARLTKRSFRSEYATARGLARGSVQFVCVDPRIFAVEEKSIDIDLLATETNGQVAIDNDGDFQDGALPVLTITGPATNPTIQNQQDDNRTIKLETVLTAVDTLTIDVAQRLIEKNGVRTYPVAQDNEWWSILPGSNTISYSRQAGNTGAASKLTIEYRDTWM